MTSVHRQREYHGLRPDIPGLAAAPADHSVACRRHLADLIAADQAARRLGPGRPSHAAKVLAHAADMRLKAARPLFVGLFR